MQHPSLISQFTYNHDIYYMSSILNNDLFSSINYVWNKIDKRHEYTIIDGILI
jgi:hypothetical protein